MKRQSIVLWLGLIFLATLVTSCKQSTENTTTLLSETPLPPASTTTFVPSFTPLPTNSPAPTPPPSAIPTLPVERAQAELLKLLFDNNGCRLPCLWGIVPGESSFEEAEAILRPLASVSEFTAFKSGFGSITPHFIEGSMEFYTTVDFIANQDNNIVNHIAFNVEAHKPLAQGGYQDVFDSKLFGEKVSAYTLSNILTEQGAPSSVMLATFGGPLTRGGTGGFDILLEYPDQGILVNYTTQMHLIGANVRGCPGNAHVEMELYAPGQADSFFERLKATDWTVKLDHYKPLEEVTIMSVQDFYTIFRESTSECIETPAKLWPVPEP